MNKLIAILFVMACCTKVTAQLSNKFIASLPEKTGLPLAGKKTLTVKEKISVIGNFRTSFTIPKEFIPVYDSITTSLCLDFKEEKNPYEKIEIGYRLTSFYNLIGDYEKSLLYTDQVLELADKYDTAKIKIIKVGHQRLKGALLSKLRRQEEAINFINTCLDEARARKDTFGIGLLLYAEANTYSSINLSATAVQYIDSSFYYYDLVKTKSSELTKAYAESVAMKFLQTFNLFEETNDTAYLQKLRDIIAFGKSKNINRPFFVVYPVIEAFSRKEFDTAIARCDTFLIKSNQTKLSINDYIALVVTKYKALSLYEMGHLKEGVLLLEKPLQEIMDNPGKDEGVTRLRLPFLYKTSGLLQDFYKTNHNWEKAYYYLSIYKLVRDTLDFISNQGKIFEANQKYNFAKKEVTVNELEKDNAVKIKEKNLALFITIISLLSFITIGTVLYNRYKNVTLTKKIAAQEAQNKIDRLNITSQLQISELEDKNSIAKQEEQKRLGRELHDELAGDIVFLKSKIELEIMNRKDKEATDSLQEISAYTGDIYEKVRHKSHTWYNARIEESDSSVKKRIELLIDNGLPDDKYKKNISIDDHALQLLSLDTKIEILYIIREALSNILKHANATLIEIVIYEDISGVVLDITDNGKGFDTALIKKGVGLQSIAGRAQQINGKLSITSGKKGTEINIVIPAG
ncbi:sensor histidine kinase [Ferruginibacter sp. SUN106]|uniref:sensor histidine kinase n=1 Tax=Ferruginibacter sp. SUN106 TaxID=2978348 RepID=UPI003D35EB1A